MSIPVRLADLGHAVARRRFAYVVTVTAEGAAHVLAATVTVREGVLRMDVGASTRRNVAERPAVTLVFPPVDDASSGAGDHEDHTLLVDGRGRTDGDALLVEPTWAVLHRPAPRDEDDPARCS